MEQRPVGYTVLTSTGQVITGSGEFIGVVASSTSSSASSLTLYDGFGSTGRLIFSAYVPAYDSRVFSLGVGIPFVRGLYVVFGGGSSSVTVVFRAVRAHLD